MIVLRLQSRRQLDVPGLFQAQRKIPGGALLERSIRLAGDADDPAGPKSPGTAPELLFSDIELRVLGDYAQSRRRPWPSSLQAAVREVAILGGYTNRKHDPTPGHQLMWHGYAKLANMSSAYALRDEIG